MKFFVYFDAYGNGQRITSEQELAKEFGNSPDELLRVMTSQGHSLGHVGVFSFENEEELMEFLKKQGEVLSEFYESTSECRSYNF
jgi:malonyl CoA-acyl carrier protein transacylase